MAGGCCLAELGVRNDEALSMNENGDMLNAELIMGDRTDGLKSAFYLSGKLYPNFLSNGVRESDVETSRLLNEVCSVMGSEHVDFNDEFKRMCAEGEDNCRKKRCTDRYDSSESSDSGVAVLGCTDCSGSSSGTSDITDPGSPFSTASSHGSTSESDPENSIPGKMPPAQSGGDSVADWPWRGSVTVERDRGPRPPPGTTIATTPATTVSALKRFQMLDHCATTANNKRKQQQSQITEYFKTQMKPMNHTNSAIKNKTLLVYLSGNSVPAEQSPAVPLLTKLPHVFHPVDTTHAHTLASSNSRVSSTPSLPTSTLTCSSSSSSSSSASSLSSSSSSLSSSSSSITSSEEIPSLVLSANDNVGEEPMGPLSVSVSEQSVSNSSLPMPSPILSTPRTIRFPVRNGWKGHMCHLSDIVCRWNGCEDSFSTSSALIEHLQVKHVNTQSLSETFVCLWIGCKVYEKTSCSRSWLERHVLSHGGNKPYRCIVDGCGQRFSSQIMLERHVNSHFNQSDTNGSGGSGPRKSLDPLPNKLFRRNGKKLRYRRQPFSARMFDFFDTGIMERLQHNLIKMTERQTTGDVDHAGSNTVTVHSKVLGRRIEPDGKTKVLLRWFPSNILSDEWVSDKDVQTVKRISIPSLSSSINSDDAVSTLSAILPQSLHRPSRRKQKCISINSSIASVVTDNFSSTSR
ncbi:uncharacterized protein LOC142319252 [Lycorma delicatula]|uniref:uncharacterized protein LOC142319252 n=1 Tax=Lycorma delicatula TaxID=130591 RepID=UPI003F518B9A